ncbi:VOC family protein [Pseudomonas sp. LS1212]|uniref:VOC family protein n=1 Tax=Pseudomonas sp. LS1212 TaxID=2972478 RepID=UPI00215C30B2|nr:VOC family protein [Pseudomonas sp. LS1212]UVJ45273.1 VOC family protein [Pseudomonas sp. LS1212]
MSIQLNHTIVWCRDKQTSATFLTQILGLPPATPFGPMLVVQLGNDVSMDFYDNDEFSSQHYAFLVGKDEFDAAFARVRERGLPYWGDPGKHRPGEIYHHNGDRGFYFDDPDGHLLEVIVRPGASS